MKLLELYCENMIDRAPQMDPVVGREAELAQLMQVLSRRSKNNPALIGEPGVGKTAVVESAGPAPGLRRRAAGAAREKALLPQHGEPARGHEIPRRI
ncbi:MAG: AAA family ATPase [Oscillospiraceae bacterium]